jgi:hypothetical protein
VSNRGQPQPASRREFIAATHLSPLWTKNLLGALLFSKIKIFIKFLYSLGIRFANSYLFAAKEKLVMPEADPLLAENCHRRGGVVFCGGLSSPPQAAKNVRTIFRIQHQ